ncbi:hypothetical protein Syn6312_2994 [Synechococcus sp. PCC 6312]|nr:hypothetical protein Syn6312_2994 [Synechococcus sp. PCC 6312]
MSSSNDTNLKSEQSDSLPTSVFPDKLSLVFERCDRIIAFAAGGGFAGGLIAQVPGAIVGALSGVVFGIFYKNHKPDISKET